MTPAQLQEQYRVTIIAAVAEAVTAWPIHRLEALAEPTDDDTAVVIARITKRISDAIVKACL